jgi:hypothetical protein
VLQGKVVRTQRGIYILQSDLKHSDDTIENVFVVGNSKPNSDNSDNPDIPDMSEMSETLHRFPTKQTTHIVSSGNRKDGNGHDWQWDYIAADVPVLPDLFVPENSPTPCPHDRIRNDTSELAYASPRGDELVDVLITETPNITSSDEVRSIDSETSNKPPDNTSLSSSTKHDRLACLCGGELRLFGKFYQCLRCDNPRIAACRNCGKILKRTSDGHAECVGCGLPYLFDRTRRLWLSDLDAF